MSNVSVSAALAHAKQQVGELVSYGYNFGYRGWCFSYPVYGTDCHQMSEVTWLSNARRQRRAAIFGAAINWIDQQFDADCYPDTARYKQQVWEGWDVRLAVKAYLTEIKSYCRAAEAA